MTHTAPLLSWRHTTMVAALALTLTGAATAQDNHPERVAQGIVVFDVDYEDVGPMGAMLPKSERVLFRPGQVRVESGMNITLHGVVAGKTIQLMELPDNKLAFLMPMIEPYPGESPIRYETMPERRTIAGVEAHQVDGVDREDETNRMAYWLTDRLAAKYPVASGLPEGFALDFVSFFNDGTVHKVATSIEATTLDEALFAIPDDHRRIEIESASEISKHLADILGGDIEVVE